MKNCSFKQIGIDNKNSTYFHFQLQSFSKSYNIRKPTNIKNEQQKINRKQICTVAFRLFLRIRVCRGNWKSLSLIVTEILFKSVQIGIPCTCNFIVDGNYEEEFPNWTVLDKIFKCRNTSHPF